jgi:class 3 adenylate cyclase
MFTDIVGYTRKMEADEVRMLQLLDDHCRMVESAASGHDGEIVKRIGDDAGKTA